MCFKHFEAQVLGKLACMSGNLDRNVQGHLKSIGNFGIHIALNTNSVFP
jgi:hypothetical protein